MEKNLAGYTVHLDDEGYLTDPGQWNEDIARALASEEGIELTPEHMKVIRWIRETALSGKPLSIRTVKKSGVIDVKEFYRLFPGGPLKLATKIAGVSKPKSCL